MANDTKERILATSLRLFNEQGYDTVPLSRIAEDVGISEGNLWYHFRSKKDLVSAHQLALFAIIDERLAIESTPESVLENYALFNRMMFEEVWNYQFLYRDQADYGRSSPELEERVRHIYQMTTTMLTTFYLQMLAAGHLRSPDSDLVTLAENVWIIVRYWPSYLREAMRVVKLDKAALNAGIKHHFTLLDLHLTPEARGYFNTHAYA